MKIYTIVVDGTPKLAFRAKDDAAADGWPKRGIGQLCVRRYEGALTVRPATIPEQAEWRAQSVAMEELDDEYPGDDPEPKRGPYGSTPDHWVLMLDPEVDIPLRRAGRH